MSVPERDDCPADDPPVARAVGIIGEVLGLGEVPGDTPIFRLGATSIHAARICAKLAEVAGEPMPLSEFFRDPTAGGVTAWLAGRSRGRAEA
ncbi:MULTISPECIES: acyl carrier protein [Actinosynnema]|uniref:acyl carrier protein n=1 Tax=Actinosynnema TaxID=40566 RepID=UPI0020A38A04|nr:acyl carrier protein [Actinosynnema pretiosum]MCP2097826.1 Phosphopantetheine attachment site [Actinosynnema pretiosum]